LVLEIWRPKLGQLRIGELHDVRCGAETKFRKCILSSLFRHWYDWTAENTLRRHSFVELNSFEGSVLQYIWRPKTAFDAQVDGAKIQKLHTLVFAGPLLWVDSRIGTMTKSIKSYMEWHLIERIHVKRQTKQIFGGRFNAPDYVTLLDVWKKSCIEDTKFQRQQVVVAVYLKLWLDYTWKVFSKACVDDVLHGVAYRAAHLTGWQEPIWDREEWVRQEIGGEGTTALIKVTELRTQNPEGIQCSQSQTSVFDWKVEKFNLLCSRAVVLHGQLAQKVPLTGW
jgi:hypothetical protein